MIKVSTCGDWSALGGTRTRNLLIRRSERGPQRTPGGGAGLPLVIKAAEQFVTERLDCYLTVGSCGSGINLWIVKRDLITVGARSLRR